MFFFQRVSKGLGQLKAFIDAEEGVAFQTDNNLIWDSLGRSYELAIQGQSEKTEASKFRITLLPSGKVMLSDRTGMYLIPPDTYPLFLVPYMEDKSLQFEVFYRDNKVAFRASNGLFLTRVYKSFHTIEASKAFADDSCCFRPVIGDLHVPTFEILKVGIGDFSAVKGYTYILMKETFVNRSNVPQPHTFSMTWETAVTDRVVWNRLWGLGFANSCPFTIANTTAMVKYTEDNEKAVSVVRNIHENYTKKVVVPPNSKATAHLLVNKYDSVALPFLATIRKVKSNGDVVTLHERGAWRGLVCFDIELEVRIEPIPDQCSIM